MKTSRKHIVWPSETGGQHDTWNTGQVDSVTGKEKQEKLVLHCRR